MKKILILLYLIAIVGLLLRCGGTTSSTKGGDINHIIPDPVITNKTGKFAVQKMSSPNVKRAMKNIIPMNGGTINASTTQYFILENIGAVEIDNIVMTTLTANSSYTPSTTAPDADYVTVDTTTGAVTVNTTNFTQVSSGIVLSPGTITVLSPQKDESIIQLVAIEISHGTPEGASLGYTNVLPVSLKDTFIIITGTTTSTTETTTTDENGEETTTSVTNTVPVQINVDFSTVVNIAAWTFSTTTIANDTITNTGNVPIILGSLGTPLLAGTAIKVDPSYASIILQVGDSYKEGQTTATTSGSTVTPGTTGGTNISLGIYCFSIDVGNTVCDYKSLPSAAMISNSGTIITYSNY